MDEQKLKAVREAYKEREQLQQKIIEFEFHRISPRGAVYGVERVQTSAKGDMQPDTIAVVDSLLARYNTKLKACCALISEFETALEKLNARERRMLRYYYIDHMTWENVCVEMNLSWSRLHEIRKAAIKKLAKE